MTTEDERCREAERFRRVDSAIKAGDLAALRASLDDPEGFPNIRPDGAITCSLLQYAIYHAPLSLVRDLLAAGADPNYDDHDGFPGLIAALSSGQQAPGATPRLDVPAVVAALLDAGADINQRGLNDCTPLQWAAGTGDAAMVELLLARGADPHRRTRIDDYETARDMAQRAGHYQIAERLEAAERAVTASGS
jgi:ankyrin repeat protein